LISFPVTAKVKPRVNHRVMTAKKKTISTLHYFVGSWKLFNISIYYFKVFLFI